MKKRLRTLFWACAVGVAGSALAYFSPLVAEGFQSGPTPVTVFVEHTGSDEVGRALTYRVREELRTSRGYPLAAQKTDAAVLLLIVSVDSPCGNSGAKSAVSLILVVNNQAQSFLTARVVDLGVARVEEEARDAVAKIDYQISQWRNRR